MKDYRSLRYLISSLMILAVVVLNSCTNNMPSHIVAEVNGDYITVEEFTAEFFPLVEGYHTPLSPQEEKALKTLKEALLDQLIEKRLILSNAQTMGITVSDDELEDAFSYIKKSYPEGEFDEVVHDEASLRQWKEKLYQRLVIEKVISRVSQITAPIDDNTLRKYYQEHQSEFAVPDQVRVRQIVVKERKDAENILRRLKRGESFEDLARRHSIGPEAEMGGDLEFFGRGDMPGEFDVVFTLKEGELSDIVQSPYGYHIFQVVAKRGQSEPQLADVKNQIKKKIVREEEEKAFYVWLKKARKKARIRVKKKVLETIGPPAPRQEEIQKNP
jgi:peptidyl-prolyl cis-trans isomerase C